MSGPPKMLGNGKEIEFNLDYIIPPRDNRVVYIYHPGDPKGTMRLHKVADGGMVEIPSGHAFSTVSVAPDVKVEAGEKGYGI